MADRLDLLKQSTAISDVPTLLRQLTSEDTTIRQIAYTQLADTLAMREVVDGFGSASRFAELIDSGVLLIIVPWLIELLYQSTPEDQYLALDLLNDLARLRHLDIHFLDEIKYEWYKHQTVRIYEAVLAGRLVYENLSHSDDFISQQAARDLLNVLKGRSLQ